MDKELIEEMIRTLEAFNGRLIALEARPTTRRDNVTATTAPTVNDDIGDGYSVGSLWADVSSLPAAIYMCRDNASGAAVWGQLLP